VVRAGLIIQALGFAIIAFVVTPDLTFLSLLPGFALFGAGIGFAGSQLNNVILSDVPAERSGATSGANTTVRMIGASLGIAVISSMLSTQTSRSAVVAGAHTPLVFATVVLYFGFGLSFLIPHVGPRGSRQSDPTVDDYEFALLESELVGDSIANP